MRDGFIAGDMKASTDVTAWINSGCSCLSAVHGRTIQQGPDVLGLVEMLD